MALPILSDRYGDVGASGGVFDAKMKKKMFVKGYISTEIFT